LLLLQPLAAGSKKASNKNKTMNLFPGICLNMWPPSF